MANEKGRHAAHTARHSAPEPRGKRSVTFGSVMRVVGKVFLSVVLVAIVTSSICATAFAIYINNNVDTTMDLSFAAMNLNYTTVIYYTDSDGNERELQRLHGAQNREWVSYDQIPEYLKLSIVAIEDERFWEHDGVDWQRTLGATLNLFLGFDTSYGGSTITQQLIKNITGDNEVTIQRKVQEIMRALDLETRMSKEQILELYLNTINLSQGCYGVQTAAKLYFGKDVSELTLAECASIAGITNLPSYYDPFNFPDNNIKRQRDILWKLHDLGWITDKEYEDARSEELVFMRDADEDAEKDSEVQSYFVDLLIDDVIADLRTQLGVSKQVASQLLYSGGLKIYATIDPDVQNAMEEVYTDSANFPRLAGTSQPQSAMTVTDSEGNILGVIGGKGKKLGERILNRAKSLRQPGSSIKPLTSYVPALEYGLITPYTVMDDTPCMYVTPGGMLVDPETYKGEMKSWPNNYYTTYRGLITMTRAVELSANTIPVRLIEQLGLERSYNYAHDRFGLTGLDPDKDMSYAPLALGGLTNGVSTIQLSAAYSSLTNDGIYTSPRSYTKVLDNNGDLLLDNIPRTITAMSQKTAYYMTSMLESAVDNGTAAAAKIEGIDTAGKTGTTSDDKDRWFVGYTPYYTGAVWYGYDTPKEITGVDGNPALNLWKLVMVKLHENKESASFAKPDGLVEAEYCLDSGGVPTDLCRSDARGGRVATGLFYPEDVPTTICAAHVPVTIDSATNYLATQYCPAESLKVIGMAYTDRTFYAGTPKIADAEYIAEKLILPTGYQAMANADVIRDSVFKTTIYAEDGSGSDRYYIYRNQQSKYFCLDHAYPPTDTPSEDDTTVLPGEIDESLNGGATVDPTHDAGSQTTSSATAGTSAPSTRRATDYFN